MKYLALLFFCLLLSFQGFAQEDWKKRYDAVKEIHRKKGTAIVSKNGKYGVVKPNGIEVLAPKYDTIIYYDSYYLKKILVKNNGKYGTFKLDGSPDIPIEYDWIDTQLWGYSDSNFDAVKVKINEKFGLLLGFGDKVILSPIYDDFKAQYGGIGGKNYFDEQGYMIVGRAGKFGFVNKKGEEICDFIYDKIEPFSDAYDLKGAKKRMGWAAVKRNGKWGYLNRDLKEIVACQYDWVNSDIKKGITIRKKQKTGLLDSLGKVQIAPIYDTLIGLDKSLFVAKKNKKWRILNQKGKQIYPFFLDDYECYVDYNWEKNTKNICLHIMSKKKHGLLDHSMNTIAPMQYDSLIKVDTFYWLKKNNKWGGISQSKIIKFPFVLDSLTKASNYNYDLTGFVTQKDGKYGYVDYNFEELFAPIYDSLEFLGVFDRFKYIVVKKDQKLGIISVANAYEELLPCIYDNFRTGNWSINNFYNRYLLQIEKNKRFGIWDSKGKSMILACQYDEISVGYQRGEKMLLQFGKDNKYGLFDVLTQKIVLPADYDTIMAFKMEAEYLILKNKDKIGLFDLTKSTKVLSVVYDSIYRIGWSGDIFMLIQNEKKGLFSPTVPAALPCDYTSIDFDYFAMIYYVIKDGKVGVVNRQLRQIVPCIYDKIDFENKWFLKAVLEGKKGLLSEEYQFIDLTAYDEAKVEDKFILIRKRKKWGLINAKNETILDLNYYNGIKIFNKKLFVTEDKKGNKLYFNWKGEKVELQD